MMFYLVMNGSSIIRAYKIEKHAEEDAKWSQKDSTVKGDKFQVLPIKTED